MQKKFIAVLLVGSLLAATVPAVGGSFPDVKEGHWAAASIDNLAELGVLLGYPDGNFRGNEPATRYEMAVAVNRLWKQIVDQLDENYVKIDHADQINPAEEAFKKLLAEKQASGELISREEAEKIAQDKAKAVLDDFVKLTEELSPELGEMGVDTNKLLALCQKLDTRVTDLESKVAALEEDYAAFQQKVSDKCSSLDELKKQVDLLSKRPVASGDSTNYLAVFQQRFDEYDRKFAANSGEISKLNNTVTDHEKRIGQLEETVEEHDLRLSAIEERLNRYNYSIATRLVSEGVNTYDAPSFWINPDATNNWSSLGAKDVFITGPNLALGFDLGLNVKPDPKANLAGDIAGFVAGSDNGLPRSLRLNGLAQLDKYQVGVSYLSLGSEVGAYANSILLGDLYTGQLGSPALHNYRELGLLVSAAPISFISRTQQYADAEIHTQEFTGGVVLPYEIDLDASYKLQTTVDAGADHSHMIFRASANRLFSLRQYPLDVTLGLANRYGSLDAEKNVNKAYLNAVLSGIRPVEKLDLTLFAQGLSGGSNWEGDFDEESFPSARQELKDQLALVWDKDEQHFAVGGAANYRIIPEMLATGGLKYDLLAREATLGAGLKYTFNLANFALPQYTVTASFDFEKAKSLETDDVIGNRTERAILVERPISQTSGFYGSWRLIEGSDDLNLDSSKDRYLTLGWGTGVAGAKFRVFYDNLATNADLTGALLAESQTTDRICVDLFYAF